MKILKKYYNSNNKNYYEINNNNNKEFNYNNKIQSDFSLILKLILKLLIYILLIIPRTLGIFIFIFSKTNKSRILFKKIISEPGKIIIEIFKWFFEAKYTASLIIIIGSMFFIQVYILEKYITINNFLYSFYDLLNGNFYSIFTSIFLHANIIHLSGNLLFLLIFGRIVEKHFGKFIIHIFIFSGIIANIFAGLFYYIFSDTTKALGASGGIAGLIILAILLNPLSLTTFFIIPMPIFLIGWIAITLDILGILNTKTNTNHYAHLGGYLALTLIFFFLNFKNKNKIIKGLTINLLIFGILYLTIKFLGIPNLNLLKSLI